MWGSEIGLTKKSEGFPGPKHLKFILYFFAILENDHNENDFTSQMWCG